MVERDEFGREIVYVSGKDIPSRPQWTKHINNLVEDGKMEKAMSAARDMMNLGIEPSVVTFTSTRIRFSSLTFSILHLEYL